MGLRPCRPVLDGLSRSVWLLPQPDTTSVKTWLDNVIDLKNPLYPENASAVHFANVMLYVRPMYEQDWIPDLAGCHSAGPADDREWSCGHGATDEGGRHHLTVRVWTENQRLVSGRARELAVLRTEWQRSRLGELRVTLVLGDPGLGKTRLVSELLPHSAELSGIGGIMSTATASAPNPDVALVT